MKTIETILRRPVFYSVWYSVLLTVGLGLYSIFSLLNRGQALGSDVNAIPLNFGFAFLSILTLFVGTTMLRFYSYRVFWKHISKSKAVGVTFAIAEFIGFLFMLNLYMSSIVGGGVGFAAIALVSILNAIALVFWAIASLILWATLDRSELTDIARKLSSNGRNYLK